MKYFSFISAIRQSTKSVRIPRIQEDINEIMSVLISQGVEPAIASVWIRCYQFRFRFREQNIIPKFMVSSVTIH